MKLFIYTFVFLFCLNGYGQVTVDPTFNPMDGGYGDFLGVRDGSSISPGPGFVLAQAIQADGKILLGGSSINGYNNQFQTSAFNLLRLNANGSRDLTFNIGTGANGTVASLAIQSDGKILVGGGFYII